jgi:hypothetical protein
MNDSCPQCGFTLTPAQPGQAGATSCPRCGAPIAQSAQSGERRSAGPGDSGAFDVPSASPSQSRVSLKVEPANRSTPASNIAPTSDHESGVRQAGSKPFAVPTSDRSAVRVPSFAAEAPKPAPQPAQSNPNQVQERRSTAMRQGAPTRGPSVALPPVSASTVTVAPAPEPFVRLSDIARQRIPYSTWRTTIRVSAKKIDQPSQCACCMKHADAQIAATYVRRKGQQIVHTSMHTWMFPYCQACLDHVAQTARVRRRVKAAGWITFMVFLIAGILVHQWILGAIVALTAGLVSALIAHRRFIPTARTLAQPSCACLGPGVRFDGFYGTVQTFSFANPDFARAFSQVNAKKLV